MSGLLEDCAFPDCTLKFLSTPQSCALAVETIAVKYAERDTTRKGFPMLRPSATSFHLVMKLPGHFGEVKYTSGKSDPEIDGLSSDTTTSIIYRRAERRIKPRLQGPFASIVRGVDGGGEVFEVETALDNVSAGGLYMRLRQRIPSGAAIFIVTRLTHQRLPIASAPRLALRCVVLRSELKPDGSCGVAAAILRHRFLNP